MIRFTALACVTLAALIVSAHAAEPDPDVLRQGREALRASDWAAAESAYLEALETAPRHLPARVGLARALLGAGRTDEGIAELRRAVRWAEAEEMLSEDWTGTVVEARKELRRLDPPSKELESLLQDAARDLLKFAKSKARRSALEAGKACRLALRLDPEASKAHDILRSMRAPVPGRWVSVDPNETQDWIDLGSDIWTATSEGVLKGSAGMKAYVCRTADTLRGDFDVRLELRLLEAHSENYAIALLGGLRDGVGFLAWGLEAEHLFLQGMRVPGVPKRYRHHVPLSQLKTKLDSGEFNQFELRFRGNDVHAYLNGKRVGTTERWPFQHEGCLGILCAYADAEYRGIAFRQR